MNRTTKRIAAGLSAGLLTFSLAACAEDDDPDVIVDEDLSENGAPQLCTPTGGPREIDRIEADPRGALTMSCKAVGKDSHAFWYEKSAGRIVHQPSAGDELTLAVPDVVYARA